MNTRMNHLNPLCAALRGAALARAGAMLALALGAAQAGAVTYTVPLQFNITLTAPVCSLTVGGQTVDASGKTGADPVVDLNQNKELAVLASPTTLIPLIPGTTAILANAAGLNKPSTWATSYKLSTPPTASATCTAGTPMIASVSWASGSLPANAYGISGSVMAGSQAGGQIAPPGAATRLNIGMAMGLAKFGSATGASGETSTTWNAATPSLSTTADGTAQTLELTVGLYSDAGTTKFSAAETGTWSYKFNVNLNF